MLQFQVEGMSCGHCVKAVTNAIVAAYPEASVAVDLAAGNVKVEHAGDAAQVARLIEEAGYKVSGSSAAG
ncbi:Copper chaperone CopZ [Pigmentiphaga humi]|uniref:Copper chaperone CopZ n=2 Tax=Pigmentiphaga humi TaxID=2478468 RepID=A0A3P4B4J0_9BURK|nr:Copper chaperone CopZ [Pigmentiphaga humi]